MSDADDVDSDIIQDSTDAEPDGSTEDSEEDDNNVAAGSVMGPSPSQTVDQGPTDAPTGTSSDANQQQPQDSIEDLIQRGVSMIEDGLISYDDLHVTGGIDGYTDEELRQDVRERIEERQSTVQRQETTKQVDWQALWEEFSFHTPDANGQIKASRTQLTLALECTEQPIAGSPSALISEACDDGVLDEQTVTDPNGINHISGYILIEAQA